MLIKKLNHILIGDTIMVARIISGVIGLFMLSSAVRWILDPASAAAGLAMVLVEGPGESTLGMNTQIGDFTAFFFTAGLMACIGAYRNQHIWLYAASMTHCLECHTCCHCSITNHSNCFFILISNSHP